MYRSAPALWMLHNQRFPITVKLQYSDLFNRFVTKSREMVKLYQTTVVVWSWGCAMSMAAGCMNHEHVHHGMWWAFTSQLVYTHQVWLGKPCSLFTMCVPWVRQLCSHLYTLIQRVAQAKRYALPNSLPHDYQSSALSAWWLTTRLRLAFPLSVTALELRSLLDVQCSVSLSHLAYPKPNTRFGSTPWQQPVKCHALLYLVCGQPGAAAHWGGDWTTVQQLSRLCKGQNVLQRRASSCVCRVQGKLSLWSTYQVIISWGGGSVTQKPHLTPQIQKSLCRFHSPKWWCHNNFHSVLVLTWRSWVYIKLLWCSSYPKPYGGTSSPCKQFCKKPW